MSEAFQLASTDDCGIRLRTRSRHVYELSPRLGHLARGQPRLLAARSPRATGLASSLSGCFSLTGQRCSFQHRRRGGRFSRILPRSRVLPGSSAPFVPPFGVFGWAEPLSRCSARVTRSVLVRSSNRVPSGATAIRRRAETARRYFTQLAAVSYRCWLRGFLSRDWQRANVARGTGESCLVITERKPRFRGTEPTSLAQSFPGRPGLSESWLMQTFVSTNRLVLSMNCYDRIRIPAAVNKIICTACSPRRPLSPSVAHAPAPMCMRVQRPSRPLPAPVARWLLTPR